MHKMDNVPLPFPRHVDESAESPENSFWGTIFKLCHCSGDVMGSELQTTTNPKSRHKQPKLILEIEPLFDFN